MQLQATSEQQSGDRIVPLIHMAMGLNAMNKLLRALSICKIRNTVNTRLMHTSYLVSKAKWTDVDISDILHISRVTAITYSK